MSRPTTSTRSASRRPRRARECHEDAGEPVQARQARAGLGRDESHAHHSLAADGADRRHERLRRLPQDRAEDRSRTSRSCGKPAAGFGVASCDACHTRHTFSKKEAQQPQACQTCHMGFDHPQWEMYSASKHGVRALLKQNGTLPRKRPRPDLPDLPHAGRRPRRGHRVGLPRRAPADARGQAVGRRPRHDPAGARRARPRGQTDRAARGRQGRQRRPADPGRLAEGARQDAGHLQPVPFRQLRQGATCARRQHDPAGGPPDGRSHPHRCRTVQGRPAEEARRATPAPSPIC